MSLSMRTIVKAYIAYCVCMDADVFLNIFGSITPSANGRSGIVNNPVMFSFTALLMIGTIGLALRTWKRTLTILVNSPWFFALYSWAFLSILWSESRPNILRAGPVIWSFLLCGIVASQYLDVSEVADLICKLVTFLALLSIVFQFFFPVQQTIAPGWTGVYGEKNHLGIGMGVGIIAQLVSPRPWTKWRIAQVGLFATMLALSQSTTSMGFTLITAVVYGVSKARARLRPVLTASLAFLVVAPSLLISNFADKLFMVAGKNKSFTGRDVIWRLTWDQWMTRPFFGFGFVSFWETQDTLIQQQLGWNPKQAHNGFLEMGVTLGLLGLILVLGVLISGALLTRKAWRRGHRMAATWLGLSLLAVIVDNITEADFMIPGPLWFTFCLVFFMTYEKLRRANATLALTRTVPLYAAA